MPSHSINNNSGRCGFESEEKFRSLFNGINQPIFVHQLQPEGFNNFIEVNEIACVRYGYTRDEFLQLSPKDISSKEDVQTRGSAETRSQFLKEGKAIFEATHITKEGTVFPVEISSNIYNWLGEKVVLSIATNISERKKTEQAFSLAYKIINKSPAVVFMWRNEEDWPVEFVSENVENLFGYTEEEFINRKISYADIIHEDDLDRVFNEISRASMEKDVSEFAHEPYRIVTKNRDIKWLSDDTSIRRGDNGVILHYKGIVRDITKRKQAECALIESEKKYRHLIENSNDIIYLLYNCRFEIINAKFTELFGVTLEQTRDPDFNILDLVAPESKSAIADRLFAISSGKKVETHFEFKALDAQGNTVLIAATTSQVEYKDGVATQGIIRNITQERISEQHLHHSQKMEAIGTLAGGIAHDFNNLLTVINGYSEMALQTVDRKSGVNKIFESILDAGKKAVTLTSQLLAFSRKQIYKADIVEINTVILDMDTMLRRLIGEDISIETTLGRDLPRIQADQSQLEQIFINLVVNARDAVRAVNNPEHKAKITIETGYVRFNEEHVSQHLESRQGDHIFISVSDNGIGMDDETKSKCFEPFFTTKGHLKGTGLGLAMVYGIVKQNDGCIYVYSEPEKGTTIKMYWPGTTEEIEHKYIIVEKLHEVSGNESVLFVEDDQAISQFACKALTHLGYVVTEAANGMEAFEIFKQHPDAFDIVVTDLLMPKLNGKEFVQKVKRIRPYTKVIYISGYAETHIVHEGLLEKGVNFISKPFSIETLASRIREILESE